MVMVSGVYVGNLTVWAPALRLAASIRANRPSDITAVAGGHLRDDVRRSSRPGLSACNFNDAPRAHWISS